MISEIANSAPPFTAFSWNPKSDYFADNLESSTLFQRMADSTGRDLQQILEEHQKRITILKWMVESDIRNYKDVSEVVGKYYRDPESIMKKVEEMN